MGTVTGITITTSADGADIDGGPCVTTPVNTPVTFTATASAGTPQADPNMPGWVADGPPAYLWSVTAAAPGSQSTPLSETFSPANTADTTVTVPGTSPATTDGYVVSVTCAVTYKAKGPDDAVGSMSGYVSKTIKVYVIGGPITGDKDEYFFCSDQIPTGSIDALGYLYAAPNQPAGTTYSWSISGSAIYCDADGHARTPTEASTRYRGTLPGSSAVGDVTANVTYSLNGVTAKSSPNFTITVHVPKTFTIKSQTPAVKNAYGFSGQTITFEVRDSVNQLYPSGKAYWSELWTQPAGNATPAHVGGGPLDDKSQSVDRFSSDSDAANNPDDPYGDIILGPLTHEYRITHQGQTGGGIGCPVQVYTDVYYYTYQMTGNGFAQKPPTP